jgi:hypothetical protein
MNKQQREECDRLDKFMETMIIQNFQIQTRTKLIAKTNEGYSMRRYCATSHCHVAWTLLINIHTGVGSIYCPKKCGHLLAEKKLSK